MSSRTIAMLLIVTALSGCSGSGRTSAPRPSTVDPAAAERLVSEAKAQLSKDPERARGLLLRAIEADPFCGPAHNNLGALHLEHGDLYEAARSFQAAARLLPEQVEPRVNLGMVFERAGRNADAAAAYTAALEIRPDSVRATQALARLLARSGGGDPRLLGLLRTIAVEGETEEWRSWAAGELTRRDQ